MYLDRYLDNAQTGMDKSKYYQMCELMGDEVDPDKIPPDIEDFPSYVYTAFIIFNALQDTYTGGMTSVYAGKNYSPIKIMFDLYEVVLEDRLQILQVMQHLDYRAKTKAIKDAEAAAKRK